MNLALIAVICTLFHHSKAAVIYGYEDPTSNMISDWDFEKGPTNGTWSASDCAISMVTDGYQGGSAYKIYARQKTTGGVMQRVTGVKKNTNYYLSFFWKQLNSDITVDLYTRARLFVRIRTKSGSNINIEVGRLQFQVKDGVWKQIGGDFKTPNEDIDYLEPSMTVDPQAVDYLLDKASLIELIKPLDWKAYLDTKIDANRRADVNLKAVFPSGYDLANTKIKVNLIRHTFGFGMAMKALLFMRTDATNTNYKNFIMNFNMLGFENDIKWRQMEPEEDLLRLTRVDQCIEIFNAANKTIRGHAVLWDLPDVQPDWVLNRTGSNLLTTIHDRIQTTMTYFKGKMYEWDVCNEFLHQHWIEEQTNTVDLYGDELTRVHNIDPDTILCLNDYELVRNGMLTSCQTDLARSLLAGGYPVGCIGAQSHLRTQIDMEVLEQRVKILASVGLPVSITELSVHNTDEQARADQLDMAMRVYYADPGVSSVTLWGFSDQPGYSFEPDMYLTAGTSMTPNRAGRALLNLMQKEWNTTLEFTPTTSINTNTFRATLGTYQVSIVTKGQVVKTEEFYVDKDVNNQMVIKV